MQEEDESGFSSRKCKEGFLSSLPHIGYSQSYSVKPILLVAVDPY
jgi:hypothetical protein